jgi:dipeptidase E
MEKSGFYDELTVLLEGRVYVGSSAGSMVVVDHLLYDKTIFEKQGLYTDIEYEETGPAGKTSVQTAGLVPFVVRPHFQSPKFTNITDEKLSLVAAGLDVPLYAIDDESAIKVDDENVEVVSEGKWKRYN